MRLGDTRTLTYLLLMVQHCLRVPKDPAPWTFVGIAMRLCIELGLHRKKRQPYPTLKSELEKRLFWACYYSDRELSIALGRPPSISDHDIDVELPLDIDEDTEDAAVFRNASPTSTPVNPPTTMTCFIHILRLKRIESDIQHNLYRVDNSTDLSLRSIQTEKFLEKLTAWRDQIPPQDNRIDAYVSLYCPTIWSPTDSLIM